MKKVLFVLSLISILAWSACVNNNSKDEASGVQITYQSHRFDQLFFKVNPKDVKGGMQELMKTHPAITDIFTQYLAGYGKLSDTSTQVYKALEHMLTYKDYTNLYKTVQDKFPNTKQQDKELKELLQHIKYNWPDYKIPQVYYFISGLNNYNAITYDSIIGVGLDMYLGKNFEFYPSVQMPQYLINKCEPEYIPVNSALNIYESRYPFVPEEKDLLSLLIEKGKAMYFVDKCLPKLAPTLKLGYTQAQYKWIEENEGAVWNYFITQGLLYNNNLQKTMPFVVDGPTTVGLPPESPGAVGNYIGYQIIKKYAEAKKLSVLQVCNLKERPQVILQESKYAPR
jgi:hypothetical protein